MDSKEMQEVFAPRQLGDSHTLSFPEPGDLSAVYFRPSANTEGYGPQPDTFTD